MRFGAVSKEGKPQRINSQMSFNSIRRFVETICFRGNTGITGILQCL
jgi:hypothetical protein